MSENPYQTPETIATDEKAIVSMSFGPVRSLQFLARFSQILLLIYIIFSLARAFYLSDPAGVDAASVDEFINAVTRHFLILLYSALFSIIFHIVAAMVISLWITKAMLNTWAFAENKSKITPGWAALWFFVPIFNLWKPYQVMAQVWDGAFKQSKSKWVIRIWWASWLSSIFYSWLVYSSWYFSGNSAEDEEYLQLQSKILNYMFTSSALAIIAASCLIYIIAKVTKVHQGKLNFGI